MESNEEEEQKSRGAEEQRQAEASRGEQKASEAGAQQRQRDARCWFDPDHAECVASLDELVMWLEMMAAIPCVRWLSCFSL